jgi:tetratricopeptide (TPR) repeat protein
MKTDSRQDVLLKKSTLAWIIAICLAVGAGLALSLQAILIQNPEVREQIEVPTIPEDSAVPVADNRLVLLQQAISENPRDLSAWVALGNHYFDHGLHTQAIEAYRKYLALSPKDPDVWTDLGIMYRRSGRFTDAIDAFNRAKDVDPRHEASRFNRGVVLLYDLQETQKAIQEWQDLVRINPDYRLKDGRLLQDFLDAQN